ncbi:hypothetical protein LY90DRAFT_627631 [Neocallimastix californiae]|uniref:Uncharacterized protein n=1 Tax=Neocallimastix californiae TaxID=1754190 RepID=A0A1Y2B439_9FUNG|nr:hypothetical protein LY90DRAFT_627631 [Neocallimastix californiae]|eukprot:ORY29591.1 hypothetical protein LY90DRAFT_627631 [Neocallimastix californiae]
MGLNLSRSIDLKERVKTEKIEDIKSFFINYTAEEILNINEINENGNYPLLLATKNKDNELVEFLLNYANKNIGEITLNINKKNKYGMDPLCYAIRWGNTKILKMIIDYSIKKKIGLIISDKKNNEEDFEDYEDNEGSNDEMAELLINYANKAKIVLKAVEEKEESLLVPT